MAHISLDFEAYRHNLEYLAKKTGDISKLMVVLKDNAYGHGLKEMAPLAAAVGAKRAVVKNLHEARVVAAFFEKVLILIEPNPKECIVHDKLVYSACDLDSLEKMPQGINIHLKIDTGMSRNGVLSNELEKAYEIIHKNNLHLEGVFTHFHSADIISASLFVQKKAFEEIKTRCTKLSKKYNFQTPFFHSYNSAALLRHEGAFEDDFARVGIASYGYTEVDKNIGQYNLQPVLSLWAEKISTRKLQKGDTLGYGATYEAPKDMVVSAYDIGYGDGLFRNDGSKTLYTKNGKAILGRTSMDIISIEGDEEKLCIFDDVTKIAHAYDTISYEILTKLSPFLKRIVHAP